MAKPPTSPSRKPEPHLAHEGDREAERHVPPPDAPVVDQLDERDRQEDRHRIVDAGLHLQHRAHAVAQMDAADAEQEEHRRRIGRADDRAEQEGLQPGQAEDEPRRDADEPVVSTTPSVASDDRRKRRLPERRKASCRSRNRRG